MASRKTSPSKDEPADKPVAAYLTLTEDSMKRAIIESRGDIFVASQLLQVTALRLNRAIQQSPVLFASLEVSKQPHAGEGTSKQIEQAISERVGLYRVVGLDALHDLAAMPIDANSAQNQVKFAAAARLVEGIGSQSFSGEMEGLFREMRESYQTEAPRLRVVRERLTIETVPERLVSEQPGTASGPEDDPSIA